MKCVTRQREVNYKIVKDLSDHKNGHIINLTGLNKQNKVLEGTGALIFDPANHKVYAGISQRCQKQVLNKFLKEFNSISKTPFKSVTFSAKMDTNKPIYHTNVMMALLTNHAVVCLDSVQDEEERKNLKKELTSKSLNKHPRKIINISIKEMQQMCGNVICLRSKNDEPVVVMASTAYNGFTSKNKKLLEKNYKIVHSDVHTIEEIGGGSARCMVAEVF